MTDNLTIVLTTAFGLEAVLSRELKNLGLKRHSIENGKITLQSNLTTLTRLNLWLRSADRVYIQISSFKANNFDELFDQTYELNWENWIPKNGAFPVRGKSVKSLLHSVPDCQSMIKKAIVERLKKKYNVSWFDETGGIYPVVFSIIKNQVTILLDSSGKPLFQRGYRIMMGAAPLKETLAASLVLLSFWNPSRFLYDPFCGTGTIAIEAALIGKNQAPGLFRKFISEQWFQIPSNIWQKTREEGYDAIKKDNNLRIIATDKDAKALKYARIHAKNAEVAEDIHFQKMDVDNFQSGKKHACLITNPPYGIRLQPAEIVKSVYNPLRKILKFHDTWSIYIFTAFLQLEKLFGKKATKRRKLYNGKIECNYYQYIGPAPPRHSK